jgi:hypothetical protein
MVTVFRSVSRAAFCCCVAGVLVLSLTPQLGSLPLATWDKANHALAFAAMALWGAAGWPSGFRTVLALLMAYGWTIEVLQFFIPTRSADAADVLADAVGLLMAWLIVRLKTA